MSENFSEKLSTAGYLAGWKIVGAMPDALSAGLFNWGADRASKSGAGMDMLRRNLIRVVGVENVNRALVRASMRSYARYWREAFRLPQIAGNDTLIERINEHVSGRHYLDEALARGKGAILALPHSGNWDMAGMWLVNNYGTFTTVAERVKPETLFEAFVTFREDLGFDVLPLTGGDTPAYERLRDVLLDGGIVCLLGERDLTRHGVEVSFFGEQTTMPAGPAKLALETGAMLIPAHSWFGGTDTDPWWGLKAHPPVRAETIAETTQLLADRFAANISEHPADWHMLQPMWPADKPKRRTPRAGQ